MPADTLNVGQFAPGFKVTISGQELAPELAHSVLSLKIEQELNKTNGFTIEVQDAFHEGRFKWLQEDLFKVGNSVSVSAGYTNRVVRIVEGKIKNLNASFHTGCAPTFTIEGADSSYDFLTVKSESKTFRQKRDSDIAREIARMAGLDADVQSTDRVAAVKTKQGGKSYLEFLERLASENNYEFLLRDQVLRFKERSHGDTITTMAWGRDIIRFEPRLNTTAAVTEVIVRGWDAAHKTMIEGRAKAGEETRHEDRKTTSSEVARAVFGDVIRVITDRPVRSRDDANRIARSELNQASNNLVEATLEIVGVPEVKPGSRLNVEGFGSLFSGQYYVVKSSHTIDRNGYRTALEIRRNAV